MTTVGSPGAAAHKAGMRNTPNTHRTAGTAPSGNGNVTSFAAVPNTGFAAGDLVPEVADLAVMFPDAVILRPGQTVDEAATVTLIKITGDRFLGARKISVSRDHEGFATVDAVTGEGDHPLWLEGESDGVNGAYQQLAYDLADMLDVGNSERRIVDVPSRVGVTADRSLVDVGDMDAWCNRAITLKPGGLITLNADVDDFFHDSLYDQMTIELTEGGAVTAFVSMDRLDLTEIADRGELGRRRDAVTAVIAERFNGAYLDDGWEGDPESVRLNIPSAVVSETSDAGAIVNTNEVLSTLERNGAHDALRRTFGYDGFDEFADAVRDRMNALPVDARG